MCSLRAFALVAALSAHVALAQTIRGTVVSRAQPGGVTGAVVVLIDSANTAAARALSAAHGEFTLRAPGHGAYRLRALRIGFRPSTTDLGSVASDTTIVIRMEDVAVPLPSVTTNERTRCQTQSEAGLALAQLWSDATTALLATAITRDGAQYRFDLVDHTRVYDFGSGTLLGIEISDTGSYGTRSWSSLPPEQLRANGYVIHGADNTSFIAPDLETLVSNYFVETHCFRLASGETDPLIAIDFEPAKDFGHAELRGTIRLDRSSHELKDLAFRYSNLETAEADSAAGGDVHFARLATGGWVMTDWSIRIPMFRLVTQQSLTQTVAPPVAVRPVPGASRPQAPIVTSQHRLIPTHLRVAGGALRTVLLDTTSVWSRAPHAIDVRVQTSSGSTSYARGEVAAYLVGSRYAALPDTAGVATFRGLVPGSYFIDVGSRELDVLGWPRTRVRVDVDTSARTVADVRLPDALVAARDVCFDDAKLLSASTGVLMGTVTRNGEPVGDHDVTIIWIGDPAGAHSGGQTFTRKVKTLGGDGRFFACGVPRNRPLDIRVAGVADPIVARIANDQVVGIVNIPLKP